jgi:two-component system, OmpR family, response regulator MprA
VSPDVAGAPLWEKTVLVVEDDIDLRHIFSNALRFAGFVVREASDGVQALHMIEGDPPNLIVLDLYLPMLDGLSVRDEVRAHEATRRTRIVIVTGSPEDFGQRLSGDYVLRKPVTPEHLVAAVRQCL